MNKKHKETLHAIFSSPVPADIRWADIVKLLEALGATITQGRGSRVRVLLNNQRAVFHEPHPERVTGKSAVRSVRDFLVNAEIELEE
jgi:HicA toxin of bacterial toxin-antitoxin,